jgi:hypothetical protein
MAPDRHRAVAPVWRGGWPAHRSLWAIALAVAAAYAAVFAWLAPMPAQDYPNHLARASVMADIIFHRGSDFGGVFQYHFLPATYVLGDLALAAAVELFGPEGGSAVWAALVCLSFPLALLFYVRVLGVARDGQLLAFLLGLYLATDWFFVMGFFAFRLSVAMTVLILAVAHLLRGRRSILLFSAYCGLVICAYLLHLSGIVFLIAAIGASSLHRLWTRTGAIGTEIGLLIPPAAALAWHFGAIAGYSLPGDLPSEDPTVWLTVSEKILRLSWEFHRFARRPDDLMLAAFAVCILWQTFGAPARRTLRQPAVVEQLIVGATFLVMYFALPVGTRDGWFLDVRPLPLVAVSLVVISLHLGEDAVRVHGSGSTVAVPLVVALLLVVGNLAYIARHAYHDNAWLRDYRAIVAVVPAGAYVLPVYTRAKEGAVRPFLHAGSFVVIDRRGFIPNLFSGDQGHPMKYFRYTHRRYQPPQSWFESWYTNTAPGRVDWKQVGCDYDLLLFTKPFDGGRIQLATTTVAENASAALLAPVQRACE